MTALADLKAFEGCEALIQTEVPLAPFTSFKIGGPARYYAAPGNAEEVHLLVEAAGQAEIPVYVLGGGTNLLIDDAGVPGLVLHLQQLRWVDRRDDRLCVGPGFPLPRLVKEACNNGIAGFERFAGIPGFAGGMVRTNSGGRHGTLSDVLHSALLLFPSGTVASRRKEDFEFGHRTSNLTDEVVLELVFNVEMADPETLNIRRREIMEFKKHSQPLNENNAGCIFRNPPGDHASRLIDSCGLKGHRVGGAVVSPEHANFICNDENATASDVMRLVDYVREAVFRRTGIELQMEVIRWP